MFGVSAAFDSGKLASLKLLKVALGMPFFHPLSLMNQNRSVFGVNVGHLWHESAKIRLWAEALLRGVAEGWVRPHVDKAFSLDRAGEAQAYIEERRNIGKVVLTP
jgi:NADPH:quinone reductase-like Zn-dependent oxidoreductase